MKKYLFTTRMEVRDYECDIEGIVNNANYLHYAEHTRHRFLQHAGISFAKLHREKDVSPVVARMQLKFKAPLRCDDEMVSCLNLHKEGVRYIFDQDIYRASDMKLCFHGDIELVMLIGGKLGESVDYDRAFGFETSGLLDNTK